MNKDWSNIIEEVVAEQVIHTPPKEEIRQKLLMQTLEGQRIMCPLARTRLMDQVRDGTLVRYSCCVMLDEKKEKDDEIIRNLSLIVAVYTKLCQDLHVDQLFYPEPQLVRSDTVEVERDEFLQCLRVKITLYGPPKQ